MSYFFGIFAYANNGISIYQTDMSQAEFTARLKRASTLEAGETGEVMIPTLDGRKLDAWEELTDGKLYLHEKAAFGVASRVKKIVLAYMRRQRIAEFSKKKRKRKQYGI